MAEDGDSGREIEQWEPLFLPVDYSGILLPLASLVGQTVKRPPAMWESQV